MAVDNRGGLTEGQRQYDADKAREAAEFAAWDQSRNAALDRIEAAGGGSGGGGLQASGGGSADTRRREIGSNGGGDGYRAIGSDYRQDPEYAVWKETQDAIREGARGGRGNGSLATRVLGSRWGRTMSGGLSEYDKARIRTGNTTSGYERALRRISGAINGPAPSTTITAPASKPANGEAQEPATTQSAATGQAAYRAPSYYDNKIPLGKGLTSPDSGIRMTDATRKRYGIGQMASEWGA